MGSISQNQPKNPERYWGGGKGESQRQTLTKQGFVWLQPNLPGSRDAAWGHAAYRCRLDVRCRPRVLTYPKPFH